MKSFSFENVSLTKGYLYEKQNLNRKTTIYSVYDRFYETGRIGAFDFDYSEATHDISKKPHVFWDSDVAKWIEGVAYILKKHKNEKLEALADSIIEKIKEHQDANGYFNIYFTVCAPERRFTDRDLHELYCAGHLMEAAVAYADATGKSTLLECMERYADHIKKVFVDDKSTSFVSPGHEEIELALMRMYKYTENKKYLQLAEHFINIRGTESDTERAVYNQSHMPVREQKVAVGHSVRAMYLYTSMALLAEETCDAELTDACKALWEDTVYKKMYITGGIGSSRINEGFTSPYDLPNDHAYAETCAGIGLMFFSDAMMSLHCDSRYADIIERVLYNGVLSSLSIDGRSFFYENPLEINLSERFEARGISRVFPITQRVECFDCSCCPPNINRVLPTLEKYVYAYEDDTLYINQFVSSTLESNGATAMIVTEYPNNGDVSITVRGFEKIAIRIPSWCDSFGINKKYIKENGYAFVENNGDEIKISFDMTPKTVYADPRIKDAAGKVAIMRGPIVYCAEGVDNGDDLHSFVIPSVLKPTEEFEKNFGLFTLEVECKKRIPFASGLYSNTAPKTKAAVLKLIPYNCFANRGESDMAVWFCGEYI